jgi:hypothetical protein
MAGVDGWFIGLREVYQPGYNFAKAGAAHDRFGFCQRPLGQRDSAHRLWQAAARGAGRLGDESSAAHAGLHD